MKITVDDGIYHFGIDILTKSKKTFINRLRRLKTTVSIEDGGSYYEDRSYTQIWIATKWTEDKLEDWLWHTKGVDYVGVFIMEPPSIEE